MLLVCESPEIPIILYVLYIRIILNRTELAEVGRNTKTVVGKISNIKGYRAANKVNRNYRNVISCGSISFAYSRILKVECNV